MWCGQTFTKVAELVAHTDKCREEQRREKDEKIMNELGISESHPIVELLRPPKPSTTCKRMVSEVLDGFLYVGSSECARDLKWLKENQIKFILNTADEVKSPKEDYKTLGIELYQLNISDSERFSMRSIFDDACNFIGKVFFSRIES